MANLNGTYGKPKAGRVPRVQSFMKIASARLFTKTEAQKIYADFGWQCQICGLYETAAGLEIIAHIPSQNPCRQKFHVDCIDKLAIAAATATTKRKRK